MMIKVRSVFFLACIPSFTAFTTISPFRLKCRTLALSLYHSPVLAVVADDECRDRSRRRLFLSSAIFITAEGKRPIERADASEVRAPLELLRPATRVKLYIDKSISVCSEAKEKSLGIDAIQRFFEEEQIFMTDEERALSKRYLEIKTSSAWQQARLKERESLGAEIGIDYTTPYDKFNTAIQQWGDKRQFKILRERQRGLEGKNAMRASFNAYTNNLVFGDQYQLNLEGDERKAAVRNDALPNVNAVVVSDLDLRDLYRNQVLQNMDDAKAELDYQLKTDDVDIDEILSCLTKAQRSCEEWFRFIPRDDVEAALNAIGRAQ